MKIKHLIYGLAKLFDFFNVIKSPARQSLDKMKKEWNNKII